MDSSVPLSPETSAERHHIRALGEGPGAWPGPRPPRSGPCPPRPRPHPHKSWLGAGAQGWSPLTLALCSLHCSHTPAFGRPLPSAQSTETRRLKQAAVSREGLEPETPRAMSAGGSGETPTFPGVWRCLVLGPVARPPSPCLRSVRLPALPLTGPGEASHVLPEPVALALWALTARTGLRFQ